MTQRRASIAIVSSLALVWLSPQSARAYDPKAHSRIVEVAALAMQDDAAQPPVPSGASTQEFADYLTLARAAPAALGQLGTGLPTKVLGTNVNPFPFVTNSPDSYPFQPTYTFDGPIDPETGNPTPVAHTPQCEIYADDNLADPGQFRISEFRYLPTTQTAAPCALQKVVDTAEARRAVLGSVLGWHAASIDYHMNDSVLWIKPTNSLGASTVKAFAHDAVTLAVGSIILPFYCLFKLISDGECDTDEPYALADQVNPVDFIDGFIPGFGDIRSDAYTGLWHFIDIDRPGEFNNISGMHYTTAGPQRRPGAIDVALIAATDISGLSLNAYASDGDDIYGDEDDVNRLGPAPWQAYSIGHIEFSSLDNLATYGWKKWVNSGRRTAEGLAWPLHAICDGAAPHHVVGSTSWGHRALEPGVDNALDIFFPAAGAEREAQHSRVLSASYAWWTLLHSTVDAAHPHGNIETYIEQVALATRTQILSNGEWAYKDGTSLQALVDDKDGERAYVEDERANVQTLLDLSSAATLAFLTFASERAADRGDGNAKCPPGTAFHIFEGCLSNSTDPTQWPNNGCNQWEAYCNTDADCGIVELTCENHCCRTLLQ
jgi:hypothetical protein